MGTVANSVAFANDSNMGDIEKASVVAESGNNGKNDVKRIKFELLLAVQDTRYVAFQNILLTFFMIFLGAFSMMIIENWGFNEAWWFSVVTISTVGYGDVEPSSRAGKIFTTFYITIGCAVYAKILRDLILVSTMMMDCFSGPELWACYRDVLYKLLRCVCDIYVIYMR